MKVIVALTIPILLYILLDRWLHPLPLKRWAMGMKWLCVALLCYLLFLQSEFSLGKQLPIIKEMEMKYQLLNIATIIIVYVVVYVICCKVDISCLITTIFCTIVSLTNYYTIVYHGMPFSVLDVKNIRTAANVLEEERIVQNMNFLPVIPYSLCRESHRLILLI